MAESQYPLTQTTDQYQDLPESHPDADRLNTYRKEFTDWLLILQKYHSQRFDRNYRQYTTYTQTQGTHTKISDPVAPELVERVVQRMFSRDPKFYPLARGKPVPPELIKIIASVAEYLWTNPDMVAETGTMRSKLKQVGREFGVTGNCCVESYYNPVTDTTDIRSVPIEDVIFDPTKNLKTSEVYYIRQYVSLDYLERYAIKIEKGKIVSGRFKNIQELKTQYQNGTTGILPNDPTPNWVNRYGSQQFDRPVNKILLVTRWNGTKMVRIANWSWIIEEEQDPLMIGEDPLDFAMDIELPKIPFAYGLLDFINGLTHAKDLILNQVVDYGSKALNPPLFVDPSISPVDRSTLRNAYKNGGIVMANPQTVGHLPMPPLPTTGFDLMTYVQQRSESVTGVGAYLGGVPNQVSDQTKGTKGGIDTLVSQAITPVQDRQQNLEESIIEPVINKWLKMTGNLMGEKEEKWVFVSGMDNKWIKVTKGLLTGKIKVSDLVTCGILDNQEAEEAAQFLKSQGKDPTKDVVFDIDWIIRVETGSMAEADTQKDIENLNNWAAFNMQFGVPTDWVKLSKELALRSGVKDPDQYLMQPQNQPGSGAPPPPPDPETQARVQKTQTDTARIQAKGQAEVSQAQLEMELTKARLMNEMMKNQSMQQAALASPQ